MHGYLFPSITERTVAIARVTCLRRCWNISTLLMSARPRSQFLSTTRVAKPVRLISGRSTGCSTGRSTGGRSSSGASLFGLVSLDKPFDGPLGALDWLLEKSLGRSLDGLLEGALDELYDTSLLTNSSILTTVERVEGES